MSKQAIELLLHEFRLLDERKRENHHEAVGLG